MSEALHAVAAGRVWRAATISAIARAPLAALVAHAGLVGLFCSGAWLALAAASNDWIVDTSAAAEPHWLRGPLADLLPPLTDPSFSVLLLIMLVAYVVAVAGASALSERSVLITSFGLVGLFGLAPVVLSSDLFGYVAYARLDVVHHLSPYAHAAIAAPHDPILPFVYWQHAASPYGPLYTLLSLPAGVVSLPVAVWSLKSLSTVSCLAALGLIARAAPYYGRSAGQAVLLVAANPLLLVYAVGGGHNDLVVLAAVASALLLLARDRHALGSGAMLALATGLKVSGGLLLPFALVASRLRRRVLAGALATATVTLALAVVVFGPRMLGQIGPIATSGDFVADYSGPDALGRLLGTGVTGAIRAGCAIAALVVVAISLWRVRRGADWLGAAALSGVAVLCAIPSLVPWYVAWVVPAAALARSRWARVALIAMTGAMVMTRLPILGFADY